MAGPGEKEMFSWGPRFGGKPFTVVGGKDVYLQKKNQQRKEGTIEKPGLSKKKRERSSGGGQRGRRERTKKEKNASLEPKPKPRQTETKGRQKYNIKRTINHLKGARTETGPKKKVRRPLRARCSQRYPTTSKSTPRDKRSHRKALLQETYSITMMKSRKAGPQ